MKYGEILMILLKYGSRYYRNILKQIQWFLLILLFLLLSGVKNQIYGGDWKIGEAPLLTKWAKEVKPENVLPEYPRPQMIRKEWMNLNGLWQFSFADENESPPFGKTFSDKILVPFPVESALSGIMKHGERLWYRRTFKIPDNWKKKRIILHFGAVDWETTVYLNGQKLPVHRGGYDSFSYDITNFLSDGDEQEIIVGVYDPTDRGDQPRGKQVNKPGGIWYTPTTGIWQTVWLEPVDRYGIKNFYLIPDVENQLLRIRIKFWESTPQLRVRAIAKMEGKAISQVSDFVESELKLKIPELRQWSPDDPFLYDLEIRVSLNGNLIDHVKSYFGMRKVEIKKDSLGVPRIFLNGKFVFQVGPLDQGFWPDGLYRAPTDEALKYDLEVIKKLGFNMVRKHVKVEPERWYYWADKLGLLVWQDMPSGNNLTEIGREQFELELKRLIQGRFNHPSIIMWVPFNEGWGQFDVKRLVGLIREWDPNRLIIDASGWQHMGVGDIIDVHRYPGPVGIKPEDLRASVEGEFGGLGFPVKNHTWKKKQWWGYQTFSSINDLTRRYEQLMQRMWKFKDEYGMSACIYTQITDVEIEANGLMTYDRKIMKMNIDRVSAVNRGLIPLIEPEFRQFIKKARIKILHWVDGGEIYYTLDGSEPTLYSKKYVKPFDIENPTVVKARVFKNSKSVGLVATAEFVKTEGLPAQEKTELLPGLLFEYYQIPLTRPEGYASHWLLHDQMLKPNNKKMSPVKMGVVKYFDLAEKEQEELFGFRFKGFIKIPEEGIYTFYLDADDGASLFIDEREVIGDLGLSPKMSESRGWIPLQAGLHQITVTYYQAYGDYGLNVYMEGPEMPKQLVPAKILFRRDISE